MRYARERKVHAQKKRRKEGETARERNGREEIKMFGISFRRTRGQKRLRASVIFSENNVEQPTVAYNLFDFLFPVRSSSDEFGAIDGKI